LALLSCITIFQTTPKFQSDSCNSLDLTTICSEHVFRLQKKKAEKRAISIHDSLFIFRKNEQRNKNKVECPSSIYDNHQIFNEFKRGRSSVFDEECPGRPADVVTEKIEKVNDISLIAKRKCIK